MKKLLILAGIPLAVGVFFGSLIFAAYFLSTNLNNKEETKTPFSVFIFFDVDANEDEIIDCMDFLKANKFSNFEYISSEQATKDFKKDEIYNEIAFELPSLPASVEVKLKDETESQRLLTLLEKNKKRFPIHTIRGPFKRN